MRTVKTLIRLGGCPGWSESLLGTQSFCWFCHEVAHFSVSLKKMISHHNIFLKHWVIHYWHSMNHLHCITHSNYLLFFQENSFLECLCIPYCITVSCILHQTAYCSKVCWLNLKISLGWIGSRNLRTNGRVSLTNGCVSLTWVLMICWIKTNLEIHQHSMLYISFHPFRSIRKH